MEGTMKGRYTFEAVKIIKVGDSGALVLPTVNIERNYLENDSGWYNVGKHDMKEMDPSKVCEFWVQMIDTGAKKRLLEVTYVGEGRTSHSSHDEFVGAVEELFTYIDVCSKIESLGDGEEKDYGHNRKPIIVMMDKDREEDRSEAYGYDY
jgi:hypothetical protein